MTTLQDLTVLGKARFPGGTEPPLARASLRQDSLQPFTIPWHAWRIWNDINSPLTSTPNTDDLGLLGGSFGTVSATIRTSDLKGAGATLQSARALVPIPIEYTAGQTVALRFHAGMLTTVADGTASLGVIVYKPDEEGGYGSDLTITSNQSINSLTMADFDFNMNPVTLNPGDLLDIRLNITITDAATPTAVKGIIGATKLLCDVKG